MELIIKEIELVQAASEQATIDAASQLEQLELVMLGGGLGDVVPF